MSVGKNDGRPELTNPIGCHLIVCLSWRKKSPFGKKIRLKPRDTMEE